MSKKAEYCCNPFQLVKHKSRKTKNLKKVTDVLAEVLLKINIQVVSGSLLCSTCCIKVMKLKSASSESSDNSESSSSSDTLITTLSSSFGRNEELKNVNEQIANDFPRISPIKLHNISQTRSSSGIQAATRKLSKFDETIKAKKQSLQKSFELIYRVGRK